MQDMRDNKMQAIVEKLSAIGFFERVSSNQLAAVAADCVRAKSVLDDRVPRLFEFDLESNVEERGRDILVGVNHALRRLYARIHRIRIKLERRPYSSGFGWQEYATLIGRLVNSEFEKLDIPERLYFVKFAETCWGCLLTDAMAELVRASGEFDPEASTLYLP